MPLKVTQFATLLLIALALISGGAHLFALPNKMALGRDAYFTVQQIYAGWAYLGVFTIAAPIAAAAMAYRLRGTGTPFLLACLAVACLLVVLAVFFAWTYPANVATANWLAIPDNWEALRQQWEYSHAASAPLTLAAFCAVLLSVLMRN